MTAHDPQFLRPIKQWFGLGSTPDNDDSAPAQQLAPGLIAEDPAAQQRREVIARIGDFLGLHALPATRLTLAVGHDLAVGAEPDLASSIALRMRARQPVSLEWLEDVAGEEDRSAEQATLAGLIERLETSLGEFNKTTRSARTATTDYGSALERHADALNAADNSGTVIVELAAVTKAMLARTREVERELDRSERESRTLRQRLEQARRSAEEDHLTGLPNRRAFETIYERELHEALQAGEPICVAFCDIDEFKKINDTHGHDAGDRILKVVSETLAKISNDRCHVARHGGEEFVALFRGDSIDKAWERLDGAREELTKRRLVNRATDVPFGQISFSGGVADVLAFPDRRTALRAADVALYRAKQGGRNAIVRATPADGALVS